MRIWSWAELTLLVLYIAYTPYFVWMLITSLAALFLSKNRTRTVAAPVNNSALSRRFLIAIPAHNEEANIVKTVESCTSVSYPPQFVQVLVVADNCTDATGRPCARCGRASARANGRDQKKQGLRDPILARNNVPDR